MKIKVLALGLIAATFFTVVFFKFIYFGSGKNYGPSGNAIVVGHVVQQKNARIKSLVLQLAVKQEELDKAKTALASANRELDAVKQELLSTRNDLETVVKKLTVYATPSGKNNLR